MADPSFPGNEDDAVARKAVVADVITDLWPHRMSNAAAQIIDGYYLRLSNQAPSSSDSDQVRVQTTTTEYQPKHRGLAPGTLEYAQEQAYRNGEL